jgi:hypothetical protein
MVNLRKTCISGGVFWGYETFVDIDEIETLEDITNKTITNLKSDLNKLKLVELVNNVDPRVFHIHSTNLGDIFTSEPQFVIYVCNHC